MPGTAEDHSTTPRPISPISPTEALKLVLSQDPNRSIHDAVQDLNEWIRRNWCRLWGDKLLSPDYIATSLMIVARTEADGRPRADVVSSAREAWDPQAYNFELEADEVRAVLARLNRDGLAPPPREAPESAARPKAFKETRKQPQAIKAKWAMRRMFPDGQIPLELSTGELTRQIINELKSEAGEKAKLHKEPFPSWKVVDNVRKEPLF
jgi:hypothetical protein